MTRVPFRAIFFGVAAAWLATLGACGRTAPRLDDTYGYGDDDDTALTGGTGAARGGSSARGGTATSTGGSNRGGSTSSSGGSVNRGGTSGAGPARGGSSFGGTGGDVDDGGSFGVGGTVGRGGSVSDGGTVAVGGSFAVGGSVGVGGGSSGSSPGGTTSSGGSGAQGGTGTMPGVISCGDEVCDPSASVCCSRRSQPSYCISPGGDCPGVILTCSGPGQCGAGEVCCFHRRSSYCTTDCQVSEGEPGNPPTITLCDSSADCGPDETCVIAPRGIAYCGENL